MLVPIIWLTMVIFLGLPSEEEYYRQKGEKPVSNYRPTLDSEEVETVQKFNISKQNENPIRKIGNSYGFTFEMGDHHENPLHQKRFLNSNIGSFQKTKNTKNILNNFSRTQDKSGANFVNKNQLEKVGRDLKKIIDSDPSESSELQVHNDPKKGSEFTEPDMNALQPPPDNKKNSLNYPLNESKAINEFNKGNSVSESRAIGEWIFKEGK